MSTPNNAVVMMLVRGLPVILKELLWEGTQNVTVDESGQLLIFGEGESLTNINPCPTWPQGMVFFTMNLCVEENDGESSIQFSVVPNDPTDTIMATVHLRSGGMATKRSVSATLPGTEDCKFARLLRRIASEIRAAKNEEFFQLRIKEV